MGIPASAIFLPILGNGRVSVSTPYGKVKMSASKALQQMESQSDHNGISFLITRSPDKPPTATVKLDSPSGIFEIEKTWSGRESVGELVPPSVSMTKRRKAVLMSLPSVSVGIEVGKSGNVRYYAYTPKQINSGFDEHWFGNDLHTYCFDAKLETKSPC